MKVAMIGGTGFVGSYITDELISHNMIPRLLIREGSESKLLSQRNVKLFMEICLITMIELRYLQFWRCWKVVTLLFTTLV